MDDRHEERAREIREQIQDLAVEGIAVTARSIVEDVEESLDGVRIDPLSFVLGGIDNQLRGEVPDFVLAKVLAEAARILGPAVGMPDPDGDPFAELPVFDPENGS